MITSVLSEAGPRGRSALVLAKDVGHEGTPDSQRDQLSRDIRALRRAGLEISNVAEPGAEGRWVLRPQDSRVRLAFSDAERAELARAALLSEGERSDRLIAQIGGDEPQRPGAAMAVQAGVVPRDLDRLLHAVASRCSVHFDYSGRQRDVDPLELEHGTSGWWIRGFEQQSQRVKTYTIARLSNLTVDLPGTAGESVAADHPSSDPLTWLVDDPVDAILSCPKEYERDVRRLLNIDSDARGVAGNDAVTLDVPVTNRSLFLARLIELGSRVRLEGPDELRAELRDRLLVLVAT